VNILDENVLESQRQLLRGWRISIRQIGYDVGRKGMKDREIIPFLLQLRRATFFTLDFDFYRRDLCHARYCLVCMDIRKQDAAAFVRRLLRHPEFDTAAKRVGTIIRVSPTGLVVWRVHVTGEVHLNWVT
jgi:hypothetical protein